MKSEIKIILEDPSNFKQGSCFETMVRNFLEAHQYEVASNINFTGMEIDLVAKHKYKNEVLYVECKAKEKVTSDEITKFCFNVNHKKADYGYFLRTKELEHQAGGLVRELESDDRYKNITFFDPEKTIQVLIDANHIVERREVLDKIKISKRILAVTYLGDFIVYIINESNLLPTKFAIFNAKDFSTLEDHAILGKLVSKIEDLEKLTYQIINKENPPNEVVSAKPNLDIENISEVQESENWFDYLPASSKHFVGRDGLRNDVFDFFKAVLNNETSRRIFYLTGKSGWGKSSLISEIRGRCRNKFYKNRFLTVAIDTRSAISSNFVALSFGKLIKRAVSSNFVNEDSFTKPLEFSSSNDLLSSDSLKLFLNYLESEKKVLIIIFDQFEDVFRKPGLFKSFYKFLSDVTDSKSNLIVGFSWKTEILIPSENEAYHFWQQAKEQAASFTVPEFGSKEISGIVKQLENSTSKLAQDLKRRIIESSQGLPWLTKKLCIHIYQQIKSGVKQEKLVTENLNIKELFQKDLESVTAEELTGLKYIAKKAYEGNFFDITELGEKISEVVIESLTHKRLVIKSGANYNIYWDIFRDYLVTNEPPQIGESYILRQGANLCWEVLSQFKNKDDTYTIYQLQSAYPRTVKKQSIENILIELRNIGIIEKIENEERFRVTTAITVVSKDEFINFITNKFLNYTPYLRLLKIDKDEITYLDIVQVLKDVFKGYEFQDKTWEAYSKNLIAWMYFSKLGIKDKIREPKKGRKVILGSRETVDNLHLKSSYKEIAQSLEKLKISGSKIGARRERDLLILGFIDVNRKITDLTTKYFDIEDKNEKAKFLREVACTLPKMKNIQKILSKNKKIKAKELLKILPLNYLEGKKESTKLIYSGILLTWFKK